VPLLVLGLLSPVLLLGLVFALSAYEDRLPGPPARRGGHRPPGALAGHARGRGKAAIGDRRATAAPPRPVPPDTGEAAATRA
jgi:hypothetical protein